jgi:hypothetical protein
MIECPKCGFRNPDDAEFCLNTSGCRTFLGYEGKKRESLPGGVMVSLSPSIITVAPGAEASCEVRVRNRSSIVDQFTVSIVGEGASWSVAEPAMLALFPDAEATSMIRFRPPKSSDVPAGRMTFAIRVQSKATPGVETVQNGMLDVLDFSSAAARLLPRTSRGSTTANYRLVLENLGNAPLRVNLEGSDPDELLTIKVDPPIIAVQPGKSGIVQVEVQPRTALQAGAPQARSFQVRAQPDVGIPLVVDGIMVQEPVPAPPPLVASPGRRRWFPVGLIAIPLLVVGAAAAVFVPRLFSSKHLAPTGTGSPPVSASRADAYRQAVIADSPIVYYRMSEASGGIAHDTSGHGIDVGFTGNVTVGADAGPFPGDRAFQFNGGYIAVPDSAAFRSKEITIEAWIYLTYRPTSFENLVSKASNDGYRVRIDANTLYPAFLDIGATNDLMDKTAVPMDRWVYLVFVGSSTGLRIYVDGHPDVVNAAAFVADANPGVEVQIGACSVGACAPMPEWFIGDLAHVAIYDHALSGPRIRAHYQAATQ